MWKKVRCAAVGFRVPPSGRVKKCKSGFFREARVDEEMDHVTRGGEGPSAVGAIFPDLPTVSEVMLFILGLC